jgi:hypothetical protein
MKKASAESRLNFFSIIKRNFLLIFVVAVFLTLSGMNIQLYMQEKALSLGDLPVLKLFFPSSKVISERVTESVIPKKGIKTKIVFGDAIVKLVSLGVIDKQKIEDIYKSRGGLSKVQKDMLEKPNTEPLTINADNAQWLVNMLWPIGLANKMEINKQSPLNGANVNNYASTGGWTLGKEASGGAYFNKFDIIPLNADQQKHAKFLAEKIYRPCCDASSFFQDCNHGSAAMAIIELGIAQKLSDEEIFKTALAFNSYWFPQSYVETALYLKKVKNTNWDSMPAEQLLAKDYSSGSGWSKNIHSFAKTRPDIIPASSVSGGSCGA